VGILLALVSLLAGLLLLTISSWFITATALTGIGLISLQVYNLFLPSAVIRILALGRPLARYQERLITHKASLNILTNTRSWLFSAVTRVKKDNLTKFRTSELVREIIADIGELDQFYLGMVVPWISAAGVFFISIIYFAMVSSPTSWIAILMFFISGLIIPYLAYRAAKSPEEMAMYLQKQLQNDLSAFLRGFNDLRNYGLIGVKAQVMSRHLKVEQKIVKKSRQNLACYVLVQQLFLNFLFLTAAFLIWKNSASLDGPTMVLLILSLLALTEILLPLPGHAHQFARTSLAGKRIKQWEGKQYHPRPDIILPEIDRVSPIILKDLSYACGTRTLFKDLCFSFPAKSICVVSGSNGVGKTTLLDILSGLRSPDAGEIIVGGVSLGDIHPESLVGKIGYMEQQAAIFDTSIFENIAIGKSTAPAAGVFQAALLAGLGPTIQKHPDFLTWKAGVSGVNISGGQARMISLARIVLKDPPILLLDEPTEGLDVHAEKELIKLLLSWKRTKIVIIVTHKLSLQAIADVCLNIPERKAPITVV
ncbi:MAG TPA: ATP-binding cassette domain-containing protein, partial [Mucilaginibacter sp.]